MKIQFTLLTRWKVDKDSEVELPKSETEQQTSPAAQDEDHDRVQGVQSLVDNHSENMALEAHPESGASAPLDNIEGGWWVEGEGLPRTKCGIVGPDARFIKRITAAFWLHQVIEFGIF